MNKGSSKNDVNPISGWEKADAPISVGGALSLKHGTSLLGWSTGRGEGSGLLILDAGIVFWAVPEEFIEDEYRAQSFFCPRSSGCLLRRLRKRIISIICSTITERFSQEKNNTAKHNFLNRRFKFVKLYVCIFGQWWINQRFYFLFNFSFGIHSCKVHRIDCGLWMKWRINERGFFLICVCFSMGCNGLAVRPRGHEWKGTFQKKSFEKKVLWQF